MKKTTLLIAVILISTNGFSQHKEKDKIIATSKDYFEGWYDGDTIRMKRALHPELRKTIMIPAKSKKGQTLYHSNKKEMVGFTKIGYGKTEPRDSLNHTYKVLDIYNGVISIVRAESFQFVDYLQLIKYNGEWKILNVLWESKVSPKSKPD